VERLGTQVGPSPYGLPIGKELRLLNVVIAKKGASIGIQ
jgi:hypothetical protein